MKSIVPFLWFNNEAEEAMNFYVSVFKDARIKDVKLYDENGPGVPGTVMMCTMEVQGQEIYALNGGNQFKFNPAISLFINCDTQQEVDDYWAKLTEGGEEVGCGWVTDKYGVSWQVVPTLMLKLLRDPDKEKSGRAFKAMMQMKKLDSQKLQDAFDGK